MNPFTINHVLAESSKVVLPNGKKGSEGSAIILDEARVFTGKEMKLRVFDATDSKLMKLDHALNSGRGVWLHQ